MPSDPKHRNAHDDPDGSGDPLTGKSNESVDSQRGPKSAGTGEFTFNSAAPPGPEPVATTDYSRDAEPGTVVANRYTLFQKIGEGGMGEVWVAKQSEPVQRKVALKFIKAGMDSKAVLARFEQERQALAVMDHPSIARVLDGGISTSGRPYFVMELVDGLPLTTFCDQARLPLRERLELFLPICKAVQHAHQKGIVHRDLKPANILVTLVDGKPSPKVIDFGVAKAISGKLTDHTFSTGFGAAVGTLEYMSPEQAGFSAADIDTRADIYSLGVILYELLTGLRPIDASRLKKAAVTEMIRIIQQEEPSKPSTRLSTDEALPSHAAMRQTEPRKLMAMLRGELDWVVMKCLEKQRDRRYETANGLAQDIQRYLADQPVEARPPSHWYRFSKLMKRNKGPVAAMSLVLIAVLAGFIGTTWGMIRAEQARAAESERAEGERLAKLDAEAQRNNAIAAADAERVAKDAERAANQQAQRRLKQIENGITVIAGIFEELDIRKVKQGDKTLEQELADQLIKAGQELDAESVGDPVMVASLQGRLGRSLLHLGFAAEAIPLFEKALASQSTHLGPDHPDTLTTMSDLASGNKAVGRLDQALSLFEQTVRLMTIRLGSVHPDTLTAMNNLAGSYQAAGRHDKSLPLWQETLKLREAQLGSDHPNTLTSMNNLAEAYRHAGKLDLALQLQESTLSLMQAKLGPDHPNTLNSMNNLATCCWAAGQFDKALLLFEETLTLKKARLGPDHPNTLRSMSNLATVLRSLGQLDKAVPVCEETRKLMESKLGPHHPDTLTSMNNLAGAYQDAGKLDLALPLFEETLRLRTAKLGADHPSTLGTRNNLASAYQAADEPKKALALYEDSLRLDRTRLAPEHPTILATTRGLASAYRAARQLDDALAMYEETLRLHKAAFGLNHPETQACLVGLGVTYLDREQQDEALRAFDEVVSAMRTRPTGTQSQFASRLTQIALDLLKAEVFNAAETYLRESLSIRESSEPEAWTTFETQSLLGRALLGQKKYTDAEPPLLAGYHGMKEREAKIPPSGKSRLGEVLESLVQLYEAMGRMDEAAKWRSELDAWKQAGQESAPRP